jgi:septum formation inhibitor-activating ATPase MinD
VEREIRDHFEDEVFKSVIPRNVKLSEAPSHGKPVILYDIASAGALAYMNVAKELINRHCTSDEYTGKMTKQRIDKVMRVPSMESEAK